jgi:Skp family chaperone for outer membrane proteins
VAVIGGRRNPTGTPEVRIVTSTNPFRRPLPARGSAFRPLVVGVVVVATLAIAFSVGAAAMRRPAPPTPVIAVIDFPTVLGGLTEATDREKEYQARYERFQADLDALSNEMKDAKSRLDNAPPEDHSDLAETVAFLKVRLAGQARAADELLKNEQDKMLADLYAKIVNSTAELATQSGYTMVLSSDAKLDMPTFETVHQAAQQRRIVFVAPGHDITQELINFMNNRYAAGN